MPAGPKGPQPQPAAFLLLTDAQLGNDGAVALNVDLGQVVEKVSPLANHLQQAAAGMMVFLVLAQVLGQVVDTLGQHGNLHLRRTGVALMAGILLDNLGLFSLCHGNSTFSAASAA